MKFQPNTIEIKSKINQINQLEKNYYNLQESISQIEKAKDKMEEYQWLLDQLKAEIKTLIEEKEEVDNKLNTLMETVPFDQYDKFQSSMHKTENKLDSHRTALQSLIIQNFHSYMESMNDYNTMYKVLTKQTKTTPIMDKFCNSKEFTFLILNSKLYSPDYKGVIKLVVTPAFNNIEHAECPSPTMTELKTNGSKSINAHFPARMQPLIQEIQKYDFNKMSYGDKKQFSKPFILGGQTYDNQTGFGWEWEWDECIYEGTEYGEVTDFFVIGFIYDNKYNW